jgi:hypothetical protein
MKNLTQPALAVAFVFVIAFLACHPRSGDLFCPLRVVILTMSEFKCNQIKGLENKIRKIPSKIACQATKTANSIPVNNIRIAKELFSNRYN